MEYLDDVLAILKSSQTVSVEDKSLVEEVVAILKEEFYSGT